MNESKYSKQDVTLLRELTILAINLYSSKYNNGAISNLYVQSELANFSRIYYFYFIKDCKTEEEKLKVMTQQFLENCAKSIVEHYQIIASYRHKASSSSMNQFSELSFALETTITMMINVIEPLSTKNPSQTLMPDLFLKLFMQAIGVLKMLNYDLSTEAYSTWRTLHEAECVVKLLVEGGSELQTTYKKHILYSNVYRRMYQENDNTKKVFADLKAEMAEHGLKSKDMKKFIEYGWLYSCKTFDSSNPLYKLNFRDGLQKAAGLEEYNTSYEVASEITHSSPIFFYSNASLLGDISIVNLSDTIIRSINYFDTYVTNLGIANKDFNLIKSVYVHNLIKHSQIKEESFYTKYKDFIFEETEEGDLTISDEIKPILNTDHI